MFILRDEKKLKVVKIDHEKFKVLAEYNVGDIIISVFNAYLDYCTSDYLGNMRLAKLTELDESIKKRAFPFSDQVWINFSDLRAFFSAINNWYDNPSNESLFDNIYLYFFCTEEIESSSSSTLNLYPRCFRSMFVNDCGFPKIVFEVNNIIELIAIDACYFSEVAAYTLEKCRYCNRLFVKKRKNMMYCNLACKNKGAEKQTSANPYAKKYRRLQQSYNRQINLESDSNDRDVLYATYNIWQPWAKSQVDKIRTEWKSPSIEVEQLLKETFCGAEKVQSPIDELESPKDFAKRLKSKHSEIFAQMQKKNSGKE